MGWIGLHVEPQGDGTLLVRSASSTPHLMIAAGMLGLCFPINEWVTHGFGWTVIAGFVGTLVLVGLVRLDRPEPFGIDPSARTIWLPTGSGTRKRRFRNRIVLDDADLRCLVVRHGRWGGRRPQWVGMRVDEQRLASPSVVPMTLHEAEFRHLGELLGLRVESTSDLWSYLPPGLPADPPPGWIDPPSTRDRSWDALVLAAAGA